MSEIIFKELSYNVIGLAMEVHKTLGSGFLEKVYENSLMLLLHKENIKAQNQFPIDVYFHDKIVGSYSADILVENKIILELKAVKKIKDIDRAQMINYLTATKKKLGIIINFGAKSLEFERIVSKNMLNENKFE